MAKYRYGMRLRGYSIGCQPRGVIDREDDPNGKYYDIIIYDRKLTKREVEGYELDYLGEDERKMATTFKNVISEDAAVKLFDEMHHAITDRSWYAVSDNRDGSGADDVWYEYRVKLILSCKRGLIEE